MRGKQCRHEWILEAEEPAQTLHLGLHWRMTEEIYRKYRCQSCGKTEIRAEEVKDLAPQKEGTLD